MTRKKLYLDIGAGTDIGCVRSENEDNFIVVAPATRRHRANKGYLLVVCDGMGGALGGRTASTEAVNTIEQTYYDMESHNPSDALVFSIREANYRIYQKAQEDPQLHGMGTTTVAAVILSNKLFVAHVGDRRMYLVRNETITPITEDHTLVNKMVHDGLLTREQARNHPDSHILSRSVGVAPHVDVDSRKPITLIAGDKLLLCSDGLTGMIDEEEILLTLESEKPQKAVEKLIRMARERGGPDNITLIAAGMQTNRPASSSATATVLRPALKPRPRARKFLLALLLLLIIGVGAAAALWWFGFIPRKTPGFELIDYLRNLLEQP
jgi:serine/threonine protein phosphatase PrpC